MVEMICPHCGKTFTPTRATQKFCRKECRWRYNASKHYERSISGEPATKRRLLKQEQAEYKKTIYNLRVEGKTYEEIHAIVGYYSIQTIKDICTRSGANLKLREARNEKIIKMRKMGYTVPEISKSLGLTETIVYPICQNVNVDVQITFPHEMRICKECGNVFVCSQNKYRLFCSEKCQRANYHRKNDHLRRARKRNALVDNDITLDEVFKRDNGICWLCGEKTNWDDYTIVNGKKCASVDYPTIDHVIALNNGGKHEWKNVRLAHFGCNSRKGVKNVV
jgi:endogenous inhibitor of DNA gyrase (YacG/DUF329 family)